MGKIRFNYFELPDGEKQLVDVPATDDLCLKAQALERWDVDFVMEVEKNGLVNLDCSKDNGETILSVKLCNKARVNKVLISLIDEAYDQLPECKKIPS